MIECVVNVSEGTDIRMLDAFAAACGDDVLDVHRDPHHNRSVFTLVGTQAPRQLATAVVETLDLRRHTGVHPRLGVVDVVPFVALDEPHANAVAARDDFARWAGTELGLPCFVYGNERSLPEVRKQAFGSLTPDFGPQHPHPSAGACAVGARDVLVAYNVWLPDGHLEQARVIATQVRGPGIRALGLQVGDRVQVSMNLVTPMEVGPATAYDAVAAAASAAGVRVDGAELVGLIPEAVLHSVPSSRWDELDVGPTSTIEHRLQSRTQSGR
jgi:glutamate formiminotransferase